MFSGSTSHKDLRVLVTGAGGPAAVAVLQGLEGAGTTLFAGDIDPHAAGLYLVDSDRRTLLPRGDAPDFVSRVLEACLAWQIDVLIPTVDIELLPIAEHVDAFEREGVRLLLADHETLRVCLDKLELARTCEGIVPGPRFASFDATFDPEAWGYPFIVKPRSGSGGRGVRLVRAADDLRGLVRDGSLLVQEYLPGEEYSVDVFADEVGLVRAAVPRIRLKVDSGIAVAARTIRDPELEAAARAVARCIGLCYVANVQFRRDSEGRLGLLEVNPRFPGTMPITVEAGVNMPRLALDAVTGRLDEPDSIGFKEVAVVRHWKEVYIDADSFDIVSSTHRPTLTGVS